MRALSCLLILALGACGQKGQLYLPIEEPAAEVVVAPDAPEAPVEEEKKGDTRDIRP